MELLLSKISRLGYDEADIAFEFRIKLCCTEDGQGETPRAGRGDILDWRHRHRSPHLSEYTVVPLFVTRQD